MAGLYGFCVVCNEFHDCCYQIEWGCFGNIICAMMLLEQCYLLLWQLHLRFPVFK